MHEELETDWSLAATAARRDRYYAASQRKFVPFKDPVVFKKGSMQYLWDTDGKKYIDLLAMNVCISVGHSHPTVVGAAMAQAQELTHCTTMFYHPTPAHFAEELAATMPKGHDWVVHFTNSGAEAIDLAMVMARTYHRAHGPAGFEDGLSRAHFGGAIADRDCGIPPSRHAGQCCLRCRAQPISRDFWRRHGSLSRRDRPGHRQLDHRQGRGYRH